MSICNGRWKSFPSESNQSQSNSPHFLPLTPFYLLSHSLLQLPKILEMTNLISVFMTKALNYSKQLRTAWTSSPHDYITPHKKEQLPHDGNTAWHLRRSFNGLNGENAVPLSNDEFQPWDNDQPDHTAWLGLPTLSARNPQAMQPLAHCLCSAFLQNLNIPVSFSKTDFGITESIYLVFPQWSPWQKGPFQPNITLWLAYWRGGQTHSARPWEPELLT